MKFIDILNEKSFGDYGYYTGGIKKGIGDNKQLFQKILWGELKKVYGKTIELDTDFEKYAMAELINWIETNNRGIGNNDTFSTVVKKLLLYKNKYPIILKNDNNVLYRGTDNFSGKGYNQFQKIINKDISVAEKKKLNKQKINGKTYYEFLLTYKSANEVESWTTKIERAPNFGTYILKAKISDKELLFNTDFTNKLTNEILRTKEYEILRISKKPIDVIVYISKDELNFVDNDGYTI